MPKPMYVWTGTAWVSVASEVESLATYATQSYADNQPGMKLVVPSSVAVGSGSGSVATQGTVSFSGASSVSVNGCFSATYNNYLISFQSDASTTLTLSARLRVSGADNSAASYNFHANEISNVFTNISSNTSQTSWTLGTTSDDFSFNLNLLNPFATKYTQGNLVGSGSQRRVPITGLYYSPTTSFDGFSVIASTGTISGTIRVYGLKIG